MHSDPLSTIAIVGLLFMYFHHFGFGTTPIDSTAIFSTHGEKIAREIQEMRLVPPPIWKGVIAAVVAASPLYLPWPSERGVVYSVYIGVLVLLLLGPSSSQVVRYGRADGDAGWVGGCVDIQVTVQNKISLFFMFALSGWLGFEPHFEKWLHDFELLPPAQAEITPIIDQAAWYTLFSIALIRATGPMYIASADNNNRLPVLDFLPWSLAPHGVGIRSLAFAAVGLALAYWTFSYLRELVEHVGASSYQFVLTLAISMLFSAFFKPRIPKERATATTT